MFDGRRCISQSDCEPAGQFLLTVIDFDHTAERLRGGIDSRLDSHDGCFDGMAHGRAWFEHADIAGTECPVAIQREIQVGSQPVQIDERHDRVGLCECRTGVRRHAHDLTVERSSDGVSGESRLLQFECRGCLPLLLLGQLEFRLRGCYGSPSLVHGMLRRNVLRFQQPGEVASSEFELGPGLIDTGGPPRGGFGDRHACCGNLIVHHGDYVTLPHSLSLPHGDSADDPAEGRSKHDLPGGLDNAWQTTRRVQSTLRPADRWLASEHVVGAGCYDEQGQQGPQRHRHGTMSAIARATGLPLATGPVG